MELSLVVREVWDDCQDLSKPAAVRRLFYLSSARTKSPCCLLEHTKYAFHFYKQDQSLLICGIVSTNPLLVRVSHLLRNNPLIVGLVPEDIDALNEIHFG